MVRVGQELILPLQPALMSRSDTTDREPDENEQTGADQTPEPPSTAPTMDLSAGTSMDTDAAITAPTEAKDEDAAPRKRGRPRKDCIVDKSKDAETTGDNHGDGDEDLKVKGEPGMDELYEVLQKLHFVLSRYGVRQCSFKIAVSELLKVT